MRYLAPILGLLALVAGLAAVKYTQISSLIAMGDEMKKAGPPPESVTTAKSEEQVWEGTLSAVGSIASVKGVTLGNEVPGVVAAIRFESGALVKKGQVLVELDSTVERAQLASLEARRDLAKVTVERTRALFAENAVPRSQLDADEAQMKTTSTDVSALRAQIDRKTVRAPFAGRLGMRTVNLGQYLNPGTPITTLEAVDAVYVDFTLPQQRLAELAVGMPVRVTLESAAATPVDGTIAAIDPAIDLATRTVKLRAAVPNKQEKLRPGMFVRVSVVLPERGKLVAVPATSVVHASYGDSVFVVEDKKDASGALVHDKTGKSVKTARQQFVRLGEARGDFVAVLDGVTAGQEVVSAGAFKLRNGASVVLDDRVKLKPELAPRPENR
jgi:membrane fusion protein (multidrug efflux system)